MKNMADNILKRMKEETVNKYFRVNNPEEWYFVLGMWMHYNLNKIKEQEVIRVVGGRPKQEALIRRATDVFQKNTLERIKKRISGTVCFWQLQHIVLTLRKKILTGGLLSIMVE